MLSYKCVKDVVEQIFMEHKYVALPVRRKKTKAFRIDKVDIQLCGGKEDKSHLGVCTHSVCLHCTSTSDVE